MRQVRRRYHHNGHGTHLALDQQILDERPAAKPHYRQEKPKAGELHSSRDDEFIQSWLAKTLPASTNHLSFAENRSRRIILHDDDSELGYDVRGDHHNNRSRGKYDAQRSKHNRWTDPRRKARSPAGEDPPAVSDGNTAPSSQRSSRSREARYLENTKSDKRPLSVSDHSYQSRGGRRDSQFEKRARRRTREDRYESSKQRRAIPRGDTESDLSHSERRQKPKREQQKQGKKKKGRATPREVMDNFSSGAIFNNRLTFHHSLKPGLFGNRRTSAASPCRSKRKSFLEIKY